MIKMFSVALVACLVSVGCSMDAGSDDGSQSPDEQGTENMTKGEENVGEVKQALTCLFEGATCGIGTLNVCCPNLVCQYNITKKKNICTRGAGG